MNGAAASSVAAARTADGLVIEAGAYRLLLQDGRPHAELRDAAGVSIGRLALLATAHTDDGLDGTASVGPVRVERARGSEAVLSVPIASTRWAAKRLVVTCRPADVRMRLELNGDGRLADVHLLGGFHSGGGRLGSGFHRSRIEAATLFSPNPEDPHRVVLGAGEPTTIGVVGGGGPGRGHWFFTPAPLCIALSPSQASDVATVPPGPWTLVGLRAPLEALTFTDCLYEPLDGGFALRLAYDGMTRVEGSWASPEVVVAPGLGDPYAGIAAYAADLVADGLAPRRAPDGPDWWRQPIFCSWGAQCYRATLDASHPADHATQAEFDSFLRELDVRGIRPGTIVVDDRWQRTYGTGEPDAARWPDLAGWIAARHAERRRVLLWWKAWDPDGVPPELCVTTAAGVPVTVDPSNAAYREFLSAAVNRLLAPPPTGLGADGLKIDFTALTPSGPGLRRAGREWGIALLHRLLATIHAAAKESNPESFVIAHAPNPAFADVADAVRLNDILRLEDPERDVPVVAQMRHRARIARAAVPDLLVETDDWGMPDRRAWREYLRVKPELGIPSLYYTTHLDLTGEELTDDDAAAIRASWATYRAAWGLTEPDGRP